MKQTITQRQFMDAFRDCGRYGGDNDNFSYEALQLLFENFQEYEDDTGEEIELDPIAICCEYSEYTLEEILSYYDKEEILGFSEADELEDDFEYPEDEEDLVINWLCDNTWYIGKTEPYKYTDKGKVFETPTFVFQSF